MPDWYTHGSWPAQGAFGDSASARGELESIEDSFAKLPILTGNGGRLVRVNAGGTGLESVTTATLTMETYDHAQKGTHTIITPTGTDTITAVASPTMTAYTTGTFLKMLAAGANTGAATLNVDSLGARSLLRPDGTALAANDIPAANYPCLLMVRAADIILLNPKKFWANSGANSDITSLSGLTTALSIAQGGTGSTTAGAARTALSAATSGANSDITSLAGLTTALSIAQGGTAGTTAAAARTALAVPGIATTNDFTNGSANPVGKTTATLNVALGGNNIIWGHGNTEYHGTIGAMTGAGPLEIGAYCYYGATASTMRRTSGTLPPTKLYWPAAGGLEIRTAPAGTVDADISDWTTRWTISNLGALTAGVQTDKGAGTVNATIYDQGNRVFSKTSKLESSALSITANSQHTYAHGLAAMPSRFEAVLRCASAEYTYAVNDEVVIPGPDANNINACVWANATNVGANVGAAIYLLGSNGAINNITLANWRLVLRAWA